MGGTKGKSTAKRAILDPVVEQRILDAADPITERPAIWLMMKVGMHPENLIRLAGKNLQLDEQGHWLQFRRAKNDVPRRELLPQDIGEGLVRFLLRRGRPRTHQGYWEMARRIGKRARAGVEVTPMVLRHTACVNFLRQYRDHTDRLDLVAGRMGCARAIVIQNYLDMEEWERTR